jgi:hypothetical protein
MDTGRKAPTGKLERQALGIDSRRNERIVYQVVNSLIHPLLDVQDQGYLCAYLDKLFYLREREERRVKFFSANSALFYEKIKQPLLTQRLHYGDFLSGDIFG